MKEPSVLDYFQSFFGPVEKRIHLTKFKNNSQQNYSKLITKTTKEKSFPFRIIVGIIIAFIAQSFLDATVKNPVVAVPLYLLAGVLIWQDLHPSSSPVRKTEFFVIVGSLRPISFYLSLLMMVLALFSFSGNRFTLLNLGFWILALLLFLFSIWENDPAFHFPRIKVNAFLALFIVVSLIIIFFRFTQLQGVPGEMFSDHAEKLLDVSDILNGKYSIFFPRNTGREAFQFYLTAFIIKLFGTGLTFASLKIGTVLAGLFTLPYVYLLGKELGDRWVGLAAFFLAGVAYWPNVISRIGLRFPLYALFAAPTLYYLILGLRLGRRNYFILSGFALGFGLHGYSPFRIVPFVVLFGFLLAILANRSHIYRQNNLWNFILLFFSALIIFLPLLRYALENPAIFGIRALSRLIPIEQPLPEPALNLFLGNTWNALIMFFYSNGEIWVHSIPYRPALDLITAVFFFVGVIYLFKRIYFYRRWEDVFILLLIPLLMLPSILSLAFPRENPSLNRTSAAIIPVFIIAGMGFVSIIKRILDSQFKPFKKGLWIGISLLILVATGLLNYQLVFKDFNQQFMQKAWNTSEIGQVIKDFVVSGGKPESAFVVPYPYWVDTRLVGINAGYPLKDFALSTDHFSETLLIPDPKLFILNPEDAKSLSKLMGIYPTLTQEKFISKQPEKNFIILRDG